jgi:hypothetical protein
MGAGNNGRVHHVNTVTLMNSIDASSNYISSSLNINDFVIYCVQFSWSGFSAPTSALYTEGSNDGNVWSIVDSFIPSGSTGSRLLNVEKAAYAYVRLRYTQSGGAGNITATLNGKVD